MCLIANVDTCFQGESPRGHASPRRLYMSPFETLFSNSAYAPETLANHRNAVRQAYILFMQIPLTEMIASA